MITKLEKMCLELKGMILRTKIQANLTLELSKRVKIVLQKSKQHFLRLMLTKEKNTCLVQKDLNFEVDKNQI